MATKQVVTICEALKAKLGREPTSTEIKADVKRILEEAMARTVERGKLRHQHKA